MSGEAEGDEEAFNYSEAKSIIGDDSIKLTQFQETKLAPFDSGRIHFCNNWLSNSVGEPDGNDLFDYLFENLPWQTQSIRMFGREIKQPRLICSLSVDPSSIQYSYSGQRQQAHDMTRFPRIMELKRLIELQFKQEPLSQLGQFELFNYALCNLYRDGKDYMGYHTDNERELGEDPVIVSLSIGATRDFHVKPRKLRSSPVTIDSCIHKFQLTNGSLLVMSGSMQRYWQHSLPARSKISEPRINITFRVIK